MRPDVSIRIGNPVEYRSGPDVPWVPATVTYIYGDGHTIALEYHDVGGNLHSVSYVQHGEDEGKYGPMWRRVRVL